jgi:fructose/tagatose bisphosphate aldolase
MDIDTLIHTAVFSSDATQKQNARDMIRSEAAKRGVVLSSLHGLYMGFGRGRVGGFTVPAFNIRTLTYDTACIVFHLAKKHKIGAFIFEIAKSEMGYTEQDPSEYATSILAAALKEEYHGPVFIQGDHFQLNIERFREDKEKEIDGIKKLISRSLEAGFYNIDIDASTLVDLSQSSLEAQQKDNFEVTAELTNYIRSIEPEGVTVSIGGEIGHIGGVNSTKEDFVAFMDGYLPLIGSRPGISKVSVQTGTSHGGVVKEDGTLATVQLDFSVLSSIGDVARREYGIGGAVQHGASTLPSELFGEFVKAKTLEIHLATGFQNIVFDHLPERLRSEMSAWVNENLHDERKPEMSDEQFFYKTRKKAFGPFKERLWTLPPDEKEPVLTALSQQFLFLFESLRVTNTVDLVKPYA